MGLAHSFFYISHVLPFIYFCTTFGLMYLLGALRIPPLITQIYIVVISMVDGVCASPIMAIFCIVLIH